MAHSIVRTKNRWTTAQLELLVDVWGKYYQQLKAGRGHEEIYEMMVDELKEAGCLEATVKQVRGRIHNLSGKYRKEASEVLKTGIPSQWSLYSKISKFFEYSAPARFKNLGPPVYDMTEYLDMDLVMTGVIERHASNRNRADNHPAEFELEENSLDMEDDEVEPGDGSADRANREEYSDMGMYDDENTLDEFPVEDERRSGSRSGEEQEHVQQQSEHEEESVVKESERDDTDEDGDSTAEDDDITVLEQQTQKSSEVFHIEGDFRQAAIEEFLCQLYSNQLYADVMLITCHEGVTCVMPAHRMVLANFSEFFSSVLGALKPNTNGNPITLCLQPDISQRIMQLLLQYMYTGKASVPKGLLADFLRCGQILRVRGIWNEERGKAPAKPAAIKPPAVVNVSKEMHTRAPSSISDEEEERSLSSSSVTKTADLSPKDTGSSTSSSETEQSTVTERSKKRRKKMSKKASKMRRVASEEDDDSDDVEVSSKVGFDLLRSDSETEDKTTTESRDRRSATSDGVSEGSEEDVDDDESYDLDDEDDDSTDDYDDYEEEEEGLDDEKGSVEDDEEEDEEEDNGTEYIDTEQDDAEMDFEMISVVNGDAESVGNVSTGVTTTPEPSLPQSEATSEKESIEHNNRIPANGSVNGSVNGRSRQSSVSLEHGQSEESEQTAPVKPSTKPPDIRRTYQVVPSAPHTTHEHMNGTAPSHPSHPEQCANKHDYAQPTTSKSALLRKVRSVYSCKICGERFKTADTWVEHIVYEHYERKPITHEESNPKGHITMLQCDLCSKFLGSEYDWVYHVLKKHTERYPHFHEEFSQSD